MIVRIVSALNVLGDRNTGKDFGTVGYLKKIQISFLKAFKRDFRPLK
jgi:hypothetical protein